MNTTLIIMAAGIGSRFGEGIKQLAQMGPNGEIIMDYSIHDAKEAGFNKVVFIIRKDIFKEFEDFLVNVEEGDLKSEYLLPNIVDKLLKEERANVKVLETQDRWFGVTYKEDKETVQEAFKELIADGVYAEMLWEQMKFKNLANTI